MIHIAPEMFEIKEKEIAELADRYDYDPWRVRIFDMQRQSVVLKNPPPAMLPPELRSRFKFATLTMQANGFTFTTSETSCAEPLGHLVDTPYLAEAFPQPDGACLITLTYDGVPVANFDSLRLVDIMGKPSSYYFAFKEARDGAALATYLVLNPYEDCAYRCRYCSRLPFFGKHGPDYRDNLPVIVGEVSRRIKSPGEVRFINIITGSRADAEADLIMTREIVEAFDAAGFEHCDYGFYTSNIHTRENLLALKKLRVTVLTVTIEVTSPEARLRLHEPGNPKRMLRFEEMLDLIQQAEEIFPFVNTTLMLGYEPADTLKRNLEALVSKTYATVNHYIPRLWLKSQRDLLHPSAHTLEYYVDLMAFIERDVNAGRATISSLFEDRFGIPQFRLRYRS